MGPNDKSHSGLRQAFIGRPGPFAFRTSILGFLLSWFVVDPLLFGETTAFGDRIPSHVAQAWADNENANAEEVRRGVAWRVRRGSTSKTTEELIVKRLGSTRLVEVVHAEYMPGVISSGLAVFGPDGEFTLSKNESGDWLYAGSENAQDQTEAADFIGSGMGYQIDGQSLIDFFDSCSKVSISQDSNSPGSRLVVLYEREVAGDSNGPQKTTLAGRCEFDQVQNWRLVKHERTSIAELGDRGRNEFGTVKHEQTAVWTWTFDGPNKIRVELTSNSNLVGSQQRFETMDRLAQPTASEFTMAFYGLTGVVADQQKPFWQHGTFWMPVVGIVFLAFSVFLRLRSHKR